MKKPIHGRLHDRLWIGLYPSVQMRLQQQRSLSPRSVRLVREVPKRAEADVDYALFGATLEFLPSHLDRIVVDRVGSLCSNDRLWPNYPSSGSTAGQGEVSPTPVEAPESLSKAVNCGALGNERIETEVGTNLNGLRCNNGGQSLSTPFAIGVNGRADPVKSVDAIQRAHAPGDEEVVKPLSSSA